MFLFKREGCWRCCCCRIRLTWVFAVSAVEQGLSIRIVPSRLTIGDYPDEILGQYFTAWLHPAVFQGWTNWTLTLNYLLFLHHHRIGYSRVITAYGQSRIDNHWCNAASTSTSVIIVIEHGIVNYLRSTILLLLLLLLLLDLWPRRLPGKRKRHRWKK